MLVRNYREEDDLERVLSLYDSNPRSFPVLTRDRDFFKHFTTYPGVEPGGIFISESDGKINGVVIVAINEEEGLREGQITELWVASDLAAKMLSEKAFEYCCDKSADIVSARPLMNDDIGKIFSGWLKIESGVMMVKPLCLTPLIEALVGSRNIIKKSLLGKRLVIVFEEEIIEINAVIETVSVSRLDEIPPHSDILVRISARTFLEIIFGLTNPWAAYLRGRVKIKGIGNVSSVLRFLSSIKIGAPQAALVDGM